MEKSKGYNYEVLELEEFKILDEPNNAAFSNPIKLAGKRSLDIKGYFGLSNEEKVFLLMINNLYAAYFEAQEGVLEAKSLMQKSESMLLRIGFFKTDSPSDRDFEVFKTVIMSSEFLALKRINPNIDILDPNIVCTFLSIGPENYVLNTCAKYFVAKKIYKQKYESLAGVVRQSLLNLFEKYKLEDLEKLAYDYDPTLEKCLREMLSFCGLDSLLEKENGKKI